MQGIQNTLSLFIPLTYMLLLSIILSLYFKPCKTLLLLMNAISQIKFTHIFTLLSPLKLFKYFFFHHLKNMISFFSIEKSIDYLVVACF